MKLTPQPANWTLLFLLLCLFLQLVMVVHVTGNKCLKDRQEVKPKRYFFFGEQTLDIHIDVSDRISHQLVSHVLKIILEEVMGYANVRIQKKEDFMNATVVLNRLSGCNDNRCPDPSLPKRKDAVVPAAMINLEAWMGPGFNMEQWMQIGNVEDCGPLGPIGRFGWYIPQFLTERASTTVFKVIDHWRALTDESTIQHFDLGLSDDIDTVKEYTRKNNFRYFCETKNCRDGFYYPKICQHEDAECAILLASYPGIVASDDVLAESNEDTNQAPMSSLADLTMDMIREQIELLNLRVKVAWIGHHLEEYVLRRLNQRKAVMFFNWKPSPITAGKNFTNIAFPMCEDLPISVPFPANCEFEINQLQKLAWSHLKTDNPEVLHVIRKMSFTQEQYNTILNNYMTRYPQSKLVEDIACDWVLQNQSDWLKWLPHGLTSKTTIYIGGIFPMSGINYSSKGIIPAASMAIESVNKNRTILRDYQLELFHEDGRCSSAHVMKAYIKYVTSPIYHRIAGILGPACSDTVEPIAGVAKHFNSIIISYSAEGAIPYYDAEEFSSFFRTIPSNRLFKYVYLQLFERLGWKRVAALTEDGQKYPEYLSLTQDYLQANGINFIANRKFPRDRHFMNMSQSLEDLKKKKARIIIGDFYDYAARAVMCEAYKQGMTARNGYVWFLPLWFSKNWYDTDFYNSQVDQVPKTKPIPCSTQEMIQAVNGHWSLVYAYYGEDDKVMQEGISVGEWRKQYKARVENEIHFKNGEHCVNNMLWHFVTQWNADEQKTFEQSLNVLYILGFYVQFHQQEMEKGSHQGYGERRPTEYEISDYAGYAYDAVWVYALALDDLLKQNHSYIATLHTEKTTKKYVDILNRTNFYGVSGHISFLGPTRLSVINVLQWVDNRTRLVGRYVPSSLDVGTLELNESAFVWLTPDGLKAHDGSEVPEQCALESLRSLLDVECEVAIVVANILGFGLFALLMILCFIFFKRRYERKVRLTEARMRELGLTSSTNMLTLDEWEIPRNRVVLNRKLGEGAFGTVYGGEGFFDGKGWVPVAVKTLKVGSTVEEKLDFLSEAEMMKRFEHKNIVQLLGVCTRGEPVYTVMEFMLYGDLKTYLLARRSMVNDKNSEEGDEVSNKRLTSTALDVARGLSYLAELKYVHRDLACRNCLVNSNRVVKIGDFGMTRPMYDSDYYRFNKKGMLPVRWMAPESLADGIFTPMSDVWSFGVLLFEVLTFGSFPFQGLSNNQVLEYVKNGNTLKVPSGCKPQLEMLLRSCWKRDPHDRPAANEIVELLANNPRLVTPCLDLPLASVEIEGTDSLEFQLPERSRKFSVGRSIITTRRRSAQFENELLNSSNSNAHETVPMVTSTGNGGIAQQDSTKIPPRGVSPYQARYVTIQHKDIKTDGEYGDDVPKEMWQNVTCL